MKKISRVFIAALSIIILSSCMSEGTCPPQKNTYNFWVKIPALAGSGSSEEKDIINTLDAFIFDIKGKNILHIKELEVSQEGIIRLTLDASLEIGNIYFLANYPNIPENEVTTETELINRSTSPVTESPDKYFMTSSFRSATAGNSREKLSFIRSASRIDLNVGNNTLLEIDSVTIRNVADRSFLFPHTEHSTPENTRFLTYTKKIASPSVKKTGETLKGIFYVYENGMEAINISVYGRYNSVESQIDLNIPNISRNYLYTVTLKPIGQTIEGTINIKDWEEGEEMLSGN